MTGPTRVGLEQTKIMYSVETPARNRDAAATAMVAFVRPICEVKHEGQPDSGTTGRCKG